MTGRNIRRRTVVHRVVNTPLAAFALLLLVGTQPACAAAVAVDAERNGDAIDIHASAVLKSDTGTAWRVLTAYDRYPEFIPDLHASRVVARHDATVTVEQSGDALLWLFKLPVDITFEVQESPPGGLRSRAVAGTLRVLTSSYALTPAASGLRLDYVGHVTPGYPLLGYLGKRAVERNVAAQFQALADEIERQSAVRQK